MSDSDNANGAIGCLVIPLLAAVLAVVVLVEVGLVVVGLLIMKGRPDSGHEEDTIQAATAVKAAITDFHTATGEYPMVLTDLLARKPNSDQSYVQESSQLNDGWGNVFRLSVGESSIQIRSAGPDKRFDTEDDIVR